MRGTPFGFSAWHLGLNTIDSPYTLEEGETRECLNVVSTERGAIKKRTGSTVFARQLGAFPNIAAKDTFKRISEKPLSDAGKWSGWQGLVTGETNAAERWIPSSAEGVAAAARWNVEEQENPAASVEINEVTPRSVGLYVCADIAAENFYVVRVSFNSIFGLSISLAKVVAGLETVFTTVSKQAAWVIGESIGISAAKGTVTGWRKKAGTWKEVISAKDETFKKGYVAISGLSRKAGTGTGNTPQLNNFGYEEFKVEILEPELISLAAVNTAGGQFLLASGGKNLFSINTSGEITTIGEGFTEGKQWSIVQFEKGVAKAAGPVYLTNGTDKAQFWTGAEKATKVKEWEGEKGEPEVEHEAKKGEVTKTKEAMFETAPFVPQGKFMTVGLQIGSGGYLFMANISGDTSAVRWTELKAIGAGGEKPDPTLWPKANVIRFDPEDGYEITGIAKCGLYVLVFKPYKTWVIHAAAPIAVRKLSSNIGCISHRSIVDTPQGCYFLTADQGVYLTNGSTLKEVSYNVRPTLLKINAANREKAAGAYFNNHYYLSIPYEGETKPTRTLDYDVTLKSWWLHDLAANQWAVFEPSSGEPFLFLVRPKAKDGVLKAFVEKVFQDAGSNYAGEKGLAAFWTSPWEPFYYFIFRHRVKAPFVKKRVRQIFFQGSGQVIPIIYKNFHFARQELPGTVNNNEMFRPELPINFATGSGELWGEGEAKWGEGEAIWGDEAETGSARMYSLGTANVWSFAFGNNSAEPFEVDQVTLMAQFRKS